MTDMDRLQRVSRIERDGKVWYSFQGLASALRMNEGARCRALQLCSGHKITTTVEIRRCVAVKMAYVDLVAARQLIIQYGSVPVGDALRALTATA